MNKIYGLICPEQQKVMYVGKTSLTLKRRLSQHINKATITTTKKDKWILSLLDKNLFPEIILLEDVVNLYVDQKEKEWIIKFGLENLTNGNIGGGGSLCNGINRNDAYKNKFSIFLESSKYSKRTISNNICYVNRFINYFRYTLKSPKEINSKEILEYINLIKNKNTRNSNIVAIKLFYKSVMNQPYKLKEIKYEYNRTHR